MPVTECVIVRDFQGNSDYSALFCARSPWEPASEPVGIMSKHSLSFITYAGLPNLDPDDELVKEALERRGAQVQARIWDDPSVDWSSAGVCVLRSTWDYHLKYEQFCSWVQKVAGTTTLVNAASQILWNSKKTYLSEMSQAGLPVIPTVFFSKTKRQSLAEVLSDLGWTEAIIKPSVGLATSGVKRINASEQSIKAGELHIDDLLKSCEVMLQEFLPSVHDYGERALIFINGEYSHCVRKSAFQKLAIAGEAGETAATATPEEIDIAKNILAYLDETPLYARVDLVQDKHKKPLLLELELVEPSLFLKTCPQAAEVFAEAILQRTACVAK